MQPPKNYKIDHQTLESLIEQVILPFDHLLFNDSRLKTVFETATRRTNYNAALTKLALLIVQSDYDRIKELLKKAAL